MNEGQVLDRVRADLRASLIEIEEKLDTNFETGLNEDEVQTRQNYMGFNVPKKITEPSMHRRGFLHFFGHSFTFDNMALWLGGFCCVVLMIIDDNIDFILIDKSDDLHIGLSLSLFCLAFGLLTYYMDAKGHYYIQMARDQVKYTANVIRESTIKQIDYRHLVPGDVVLFHCGQRVFADMKLLDSAHVVVSEKLLQNSEASFYRKIYGTLGRKFENGDILLHSTIIAKGFGRAVVINTNNPYLFKVRGTSNSRRHIVLNKHLSEIVYSTLFISVIVSVTFASTAAIFLNWNWISSVILLVAVQVSITFESLIPSFIFAKAILVERCVRKNCYVQNIDVLETIGMTNVICTNKTGILTDHQMVLSRIYADDKLVLSVDFLRQNIGRTLTEPYLTFFKVCSLCNFAFFRNSDGSEADADVDTTPFERDTVGKPSEVALLCYTKALFGARKLIESKCRIAAQNIFQDVNKCSFKAIELGSDRSQTNPATFCTSSRLWYCVKGIPEDILKSCQRMLTSRGSVPLNDSHKQKICSVVNGLGREAYRVLAIAHATIPNDRIVLNPLADSELELEFLGLAAMENPIRLSIADSVFMCRRAGIKVLMITSEHPETAFEIAQMCGIALFRRLEYVQTLPVNRSFTIRGEEVSRMTSGDLYELIMSPNDIVFTRIAPDHKATIVQSCVENGSIVAVTGIGIGDLEILEKAQVRIALGLYGADVVKQVCDIILLDDEFTSIVHGIEAGRVLFENLRKALCYCLSSKMAQLFPFVLHALLGIPLMSSSITIVAIDLITDNLPTMAIANEHAESGVMLEKPKCGKKNIICDINLVIISLFYYGVIQFSACAFSYTVVMAESGFHLRELFGIHSMWNSPALNDLPDSFGQEWTYKQRLELEYRSNTAYFVNMVVVRAVTAFCCRTRYDPIGLERLFRNSFLNFSIFFMFFFATMFTYYPWLTDLFRVFPLKWHWWFVSWPFAVVIFILDESRKYLIRNYRHSEIRVAKFDCDVSLELNKLRDELAGFDDIYRNGDLLVPARLDHFEDAKEQIVSHMYVLMSVIEKFHLTLEHLDDITLKIRGTAPKASQASYSLDELSIGALKKMITLPDLRGRTTQTEVKAAFQEKQHLTSPTSSDSTEKTPPTPTTPAPEVVQQQQSPIEGGLPRQSSDSIEDFGFYNDRKLVYDSDNPTDISMERRNSHKYQRTISSDLDPSDRWLKSLQSYKNRRMNQELERMTSEENNGGLLSEQTDAGEVFRPKTEFQRRMTRIHTLPELVEFMKTQNLTTGE